MPGHTPDKRLDFRFVHESHELPCIVPLRNDVLTAIGNIHEISPLGIEPKSSFSLGNSSFRERLIAVFNRGFVLRFFG